MVFKQDCVIEVSDYEADNASVRGMGNTEFIDWIGKNANPSGVRWINIGGFDWDVISALTLRYSQSTSLVALDFIYLTWASDLHPLALEDVLHEQGHNQSKADYYHDHLFIRILCHKGEGDTDIDVDPEETSQSRVENVIRLEEGNGRRGQVRKPQPLSPVELYQHGARRTTSTGLSGFLASVCILLELEIMDS
ncbi:hypothetical protein H0H92_005649 [Tricholoma furcatifolium]|nr:hypothetical protein H0H92_005649 [Tricholoma furcatifolium]